jgi:hypothetical protein
MIEIEVSNGYAHHGNFDGEVLTTDRSGLKVHFNFSNDFDSLKKTALVSGSGVLVETPVEEDDTILVPDECLTVPGGLLKIGVYATNELTGFGKAVRLPTMWADAGIIYKGTWDEDDTIIVEEEEYTVINDLCG